MIQMAKPQIGPEEKQAVGEVLESGMLAQGNKVKAFEEAFAEMSGVNYALAVSSGTAALHLALLTNGIGPGDEVITTPFTFIASANSILYTGARPVFVDIDPVTFNLDISQIEAALTPCTKAILPVDLFGLMCDYDGIQEIAERHGLAIIEDACQAHGASLLGKKAGSFGTGAFSLYPTKNITSGEGGMITTDDPQIADRCRMLRQHGMRKRYYHESLGYNFRMTDIHAAIGLEQLKKLEIFNHKRRENARYYDEHLQGLILPSIPEGYGHCYHQYTVRVPDRKRDALRAYLQERGVGSEIYYPVPIHKQPFYCQELGYRVNLPQAEQAADDVLSLPMHAGLSAQDLQVVVSAVNEFMDSEADANGS